MDTAIGTDTLWKLPPYPNKLNLRPDEIAAFCFEGDCQQTLSHGTYKVDEEGFVKSLSYRCQYAGDSPQVILALLYLPPSLSTRFLSLYSVYPISRSTYYGVDSGALGLKLSLFFDLIMATCLPKDEFVSTHLAANKSDRNLDVLEQSRKKIWERFHLCKCRAYCLPLIHYEYLGDLQHSGNIPPKREVIANLQNSVLSRISAMVMNDVHEYSTALLKTLMAININYPQMKKDILAVLESLCAESIPHCARALMVTAEYLAIRARGRGGLRSGPAANPAFTHIFESIKKDPNSNHIHELFHEVREKWLRSETEMIRAARHLEAAAQIYTQHEMDKICRKHFASVPNGSKDTIPQTVTVEAAARVDLFGGWLDTPPITLYANPSAVVNMAILVDGKKPISCHIQHGSDAGITVQCGDTIVLLSSSQDIYESYNKPGNPGALVCACLICVGVPSEAGDDLLETLQNRFGTTGLEIECTSCLPHGSGLGTSSILAAAIIQALGLASGFQYTEKSICHAVLMVEQQLTTGGGWQDQVGCLYPGIKKGYFNTSDDSVDVEKIDIAEEFEKEINSRMVLIYTGKTRLAKNLLQEVVRGWFSGGPVRDVIASLENNVTHFATSLKEGKMPYNLIDLYYEAKKTLATGCEPEIVTSLISQLKRENLIETAWLAGAGGGGFLYVWLKDGITVDQIRTFISRSGTAEMTVHTVTVDNSPITMSSS
nr:GHMP kinase domain containing protein [Haemonchus contortus]